MQLLGRRGLGVFAVAWLVVGCPRYSRQPPPASASATAVATFAAQGGRGERASRELRTVRASKEPTCISGVIVTSGLAEIPVARARVTVARGEIVVAETTTDDNGRFSWCAERALDGLTVRTSVHVQKAAFSSSERLFDIPVGMTTELTIGLSPTP